MVMSTPYRMFLHGFRPIRVPTLIHPCRPKGPQSSYFVFYTEKMASFKAARPGMSITVMVYLVIRASITSTA